MYLGMPQTVQEIADLLATDEGVTFIRVRLNDEILIALRGDDGEISAYRCRVLDEIHIASSAAEECMP